MEVLGSIKDITGKTNWTIGFIFYTYLLYKNIKGNVSVEKKDIVLAVIISLKKRRFLMMSFITMLVKQENIKNHFPSKHLCLPSFYLKSSSQQRVIT